MLSKYQNKIWKRVTYTFSKNFGISIRTQHKHLLIIGGSGNLGKSCVKAFNETWKVASIDYRENKDAHLNILLDANIPIKEALPKICEDLEKFSKQYDSIFTTAGGWTGGSIREPEIFDQLDRMYKVNVLSSVLAGHLATKYIASNGLVVFTGAAAVFKEPTPSMMAYHLSKISTHALALNLAQRDELPTDATVTTILPTTIDTPDNRQAMPNADFSKWASPEKIAGLLKMWADGLNRPNNGTYAILNVNNGQIVPEFAQLISSRDLKPKVYKILYPESFKFY